MNRRPSGLVLSAVACFALATVSSAQAQSWNNTGTNWSSATSWTANNVPDTNTEKAVFGSFAASPLNPNVDAAYTIQGMTFNSTAYNYTFGGTGTLIIDANTNSVTNTIQLNGNQTFNVNVTSTNSGGSNGQRWVIGTNGGTMNFAAGTTLTVTTAALTIQSTGGASGVFNFYGLVNAGSFGVTHQGGGTSVYFRSTSQLNGTYTNSVGDTFFETGNLGTSQLSMIGSLAGDAAFYISNSGVDISNNIRIGNTNVTTNARTVGVDITGSGTGTWSGTVDVAQNSGIAPARTVKLTAGASDRANFTGRIISTSTTTLGLQVAGGGTVSFSNTGNSYNVATTVVAGTLLLANNGSVGSATGASDLTVNGALGGAGRIAPTGTNNVSVTSGGEVAPGDGGIGTLEVNLGSTTGTASFLSGSTFTFDLNAPGTSDVLGFTGLNASSGEIAFNGNTVNFNNLGGLAAGTYTLFTFDAATDYTGTLAVGTGLGALSGSFVYNSNSIQLTVVPEPSTTALVAGSLAGLLWLRRNKSRIISV
ncbi:hypothetical protein BH09VER1_BH09VER1_22950 [soil metagenome]